MNVFGVKFTTGFARRTTKDSSMLARDENVLVLRRTARDMSYQ